MSRRANVAQALAQRELRGHPGRMNPGRRTYWSFQDVMAIEDQAVLMGFSNNGQCLCTCHLNLEEKELIRAVNPVFYAACGHGIQIYWCAFKPFRIPLVSRRKVLQIAVGPTPASMLHDSYALDEDMELRVWESIDESLVVAIANARGQGSSCFITVAPGPSRSHSATDRVAGFQCTLSTTVPTAQAWFIIQTTFQLVVHVGSSLLLLSLTETSPDAAFLPSKTIWYYPSEFPLDIVHDKSSHTTDDCDTTHGVRLQCVHQSTFDIETFLRSLLDSYSKLRPFHLHDYDLRHLCIAESTWLYMCGVMDLERYDVPTRTRMGVFFTWNARDGAYHVLRLLTLPTSNPLPSALDRLVAHCRHVLGRHVRLPSSGFTMWSNDGVLRGESLHRIDNPVFPYSIHRDPV
ncbi:Aste57867_24542 [Aphanomyces stellatus]|uniref:Aste57867_24542 protein n=1 Tax=Aphanomyces stellatus TaxID=120398 RepID=A0A485LRD8_9STRA|nr:hypothetical protein As57867_024465 [Aphanomyces stellatus]VFU01181.1 Aste57867_24542 [Aphanomyces stellatus]